MGEYSLPDFDWNENDWIDDETLAPYERMDDLESDGDYEEIEEEEPEPIEVNFFESESEEDIDRSHEGIKYPTGSYDPDLFASTQPIQSKAAPLFRRPANHPPDVLDVAQKERIMTLLRIANVEYEAKFGEKLKIPPKKRTPKRKRVITPSKAQQILEFHQNNPVVTKREKIEFCEKIDIKRSHFNGVCERRRRKLRQEAARNC